MAGPFGDPVREPGGIRMSDARYLLSRAEMCFRLASGPAGPRLADELVRGVGSRPRARSHRRICERGRYSARSQGSAILDSVGGTTERTAPRSRSSPHPTSNAASQPAFRHSAPSVLPLPVAVQILQAIA